MFNSKLHSRVDEKLYINKLYYKWTEIIMASRDGKTTEKKYDISASVLWSTNESNQMIHSAWWLILLETYRWQIFVVQIINNLFNSIRQL